MSLTKELVNKFQALYQTKYGESLSYQAAEMQLKELAELVRLTSQVQV